MIKNAWRSASSPLAPHLILIIQYKPVMSFRKRNVGLAGPSASLSQPSMVASSPPSPIQSPGIRPSPLDGRPTLSTGTQSLDDILAGHAGLALGNSLLIEEKGTTDFAGALLRFYAAEGIVQGHQVHVVGFGEQWGRELPGLTGAIDGQKEPNVAVDKDKMKIAWRYERLGEHGAGTAGSRGGIALLRIWFFLYIKNQSSRPGQQHMSSGCR